MKKLLIAVLLLFILLLLIILIRFAGGAGDHSPLYRSYKAEDVITIGSPDQGWELSRSSEDGTWKSGSGGLPPREEAVQNLLALPDELTKHAAGRVEGSEAWLPGDRLTLDYGGGSKSSLSMDIYYDAHPGENTGRGFYIRKNGEGRLIYYHRLPDGSAYPWENREDRRIFPADLQAANINYYRLYTPREGAEALQYRYELIRENGEWTSRADMGDGKLKGEEVNLLMIRLASLEGDKADDGETPPGEGDVRFRVEIHDNRGSRYVLTVGGAVEREGTTCYLVSFNGGEKVRYMTRGVLSGIARPLNTLLDF